MRKKDSQQFSFNSKNEQNNFRNFLMEAHIQSFFYVLTTTEHKSCHLEVELCEKEKFCKLL